MLMTTNSAPTTVSTPAAGAIFVHGLFSGPEVWDPLISLLQSDTSFSRAFQFERFSYSSPKFEFRPWQRIPTIHEAALQLTTWLRDNDQLRGIPRIVLVGHSQGGLIIQQSMSEMLSDGQIEALRRVRAVILLATPNTGSELLLSLRRILGRIWRHAQERQLRPYDEQIEKMRRVVFERAVLPTVPSETVCPIRFFVYAGETDGVVPPRSALWMFPRAGILPGNHSTILVPTDTKDMRFQAVRSALSWARHSFPPDGVLLKTEALDLANREDLEALDQLAAEAFEPEQAMRSKDLRHWLTNYQEDWPLRLAVLVAKANRKICGFLMFHESADLILVDYIASKRPPGGVVSARGDYSGTLVQQMTDQLIARARLLGNVPIVFEVAHPTHVGAGSRRARARIKHFERFGARAIMKLNYLAPHMDTMKIGDEVPHILMYARAGTVPPALPEESVRRILDQIYLVWYKNWFSHYQDAQQHEKYLQELCDKVKATLASSYLLAQWKAN
jgi:pimeloyl-ACP methyl ester carboxylesterase